MEIDTTHLQLTILLVAFGYGLLGYAIGAKIWKPKKKEVFN